MKAIASAIAATLLAASSVLAQGTAPEAILTPSQESGAAAAADPASGAFRTPVPLPGPIDPATYRVGPGDVFRLSIAGPLTREVLLTVGPEGTLALPGAGTLVVRDRTLAQVRLQVLERVRRDIRGADLDLRLERPRTFRVYVTGRVREPGVRLANGASRIADVLPPSQLLDDASRRGVRVTHADGTSELADLGRFLETGDSGGMPLLRDGDVLQAPVASQFVFVGGAVTRPGRFEWLAGDSLSTLLRLGGGLAPAAMRSRLLWLHWRNDAKPDSEWVSADEPVQLSRAIVAGDRLYAYFVPEWRQQHEVIVLGEVGRPGAYPINEGATRLSDVLGAAGGFLPTADLSSLRVHRASGLAGEADIELDRMLRLSRGDLTASEYEVLRTKLAARREDYRVSWYALRENPAAMDLALRDGDVVRVERLVSSIRIDGEVRNPAILTYRRGASVDDYVRQAGGFTNRAWVGKVRVTRAVNGQTLLARNVKELNPGDFIWAPERPDVTIWQQGREILTALAQVATIVIAIRSVR
ncbi:MAG: SLBB domain-containing protein [Candidatus Eisenbacteria bacterium]